MGRAGSEANGRTKRVVRDLEEVRVPAADAVVSSSRLEVGRGGKKSISQAWPGRCKGVRGWRERTEVEDSCQKASIRPL